MSLSEEARELIDRLTINCKELNDGVRERVEYVVPVAYHTEECPLRGTGAKTCRCPVENEKRSKFLSRKGLIEQLKEYQQNKDVDRNPKAERAAPRVKKAKMLPELEGFLTLDEITCEAYMLLDRVFEEVGRDRTWLSQSLKGIFAGLPYQVSQFVDLNPDAALQVLRATDKWIAKAKSALRISVANAMFGDTVCGNCGGALSVAWDNNSDVKCIGTPVSVPCGETYPMSEWVALYEQQRTE